MTGWRGIDAVLKAIEAQGELASFRLVALLPPHPWPAPWVGGQDMRRAISWGVDGVITSYPEVLGDFL